MTNKITHKDKHIQTAVDPVRTPAEFGRVIRAVRKQQGLTLEAVYAATGLSTRFMSEFERGKSNVSLGGALQAAQALGLEVVVVPRAELRRFRAVLEDSQDLIDRDRKR